MLLCRTSENNGYFDAKSQVWQGFIVVGKSKGIATEGFLPWPAVFDAALVFEFDGPILDPQTGNLAKVGNVSRNQNTVTRKNDGGNLCVHCANRHPSLAELFRDAFGSVVVSQNGHSAKRGQVKQKPGVDLDF
jgi:hypothetical protein